MICWAVPWKRLICAGVYSYNDTRYLFSMGGNFHVWRLYDFDSMGVVLPARDYLRIMDVSEFCSRRYILGGICLARDCALRAYPVLLSKLSYHNSNQIMIVYMNTLFLTWIIAIRNTSYSDPNHHPGPISKSDHLVFSEHEHRRPWPQRQVLWILPTHPQDLHNSIILFWKSKADEKLE